MVNSPFFNHVNGKYRFEENIGVYRQDKRALHNRELDIDKLQNLVENLKMLH